jgi:hypothetical protein
MVRMNNGRLLNQGSRQSGAHCCTNPPLHAHVHASVNQLEPESVYALNDTRHKYDTRKMSRQRSASSQPPVSW